MHATLTKLNGIWFFCVEMRNELPINCVLWPYYQIYRRFFKKNQSCLPNDTCGRLIYDFIFLVMHCETHSESSPVPVTMIYTKKNWLREFINKLIIDLIRLHINSIYQMKNGGKILVNNDDWWTNRSNNKMKSEIDVIYLIVCRVPI